MTALTGPVQEKRAARPVLFQRGQPIWVFFALSACGSGGSETALVTSGDTSGSLPANYVPPPSIYTPPGTAGVNAFALQTSYTEPYWVAALGNRDFGQLGAFFGAYDNVVEYAFPAVIPDYASSFDASGWAPASAAVQAAYRTIFAELEEVLNVDFVEVTDLTDFNVIAISQNDQPGYSGYAYYPNASYLVGSDILISNDFDAPAAVGALTNFDYELLLHELGHALGLKHPFEADGTATAELSAAEDNSYWTVMTYTLRSAAYDGYFRDLDMMALAEVFGINPDHRAGNDSYGFSSTGGTFILDGGGIDTITAEGRSDTAHIDLRPGMQSCLGAKSAYITAPWQLTISSGSQIENASGGFGDDYLIGNGLANLLTGGAGSDRIFADEGEDHIYAGPGEDIIDLSEAVAASDVLIFESTPATNGKDTVYSFVQGVAGDVIRFDPMAGANLLSVVSSALVPLANVSGAILRLVQDGLDTAAELDVALSAGGAFGDLTISAGAQALVLTAAAQATGQDQHLFHVHNSGADLAVTHLATLVGNALDIDSWHANNFV